MIAVVQMWSGKGWPLQGVGGCVGSCHSTIQAQLDGYYGVGRGGTLRIGMCYRI